MPFKGTLRYPEVSETPRIAVLGFRIPHFLVHPTVTPHMGVSENQGYLRVPLKSTIRVPLKGYSKGLGFPKIRGLPPFGVLIIRILLFRALYQGPPIFGNSQSAIPLHLKPVQEHPDRNSSKPLRTLAVTLKGVSFKEPCTLNRLPKLKSPKSSNPKPKG